MYIYIGNCGKIRRRNASRMRRNASSACVAMRPQRSAGPDIAFLSNNQDKLQGKYDTMLEFASTRGGTCAYVKWLFQVPIAVTVNYSTKNLHYLLTNDWLGNEGNRVVALIGAPKPGFEWVLGLPGSFRV